MHQRLLLMGLLAVTVAAPVAAPATAGDDDLALLKQTGKAFTRVANRAAPSVVSITVEKSLGASGPQYAQPFNNPFDLFNDHFMHRFFDRRAPGLPRPRQFKQSSQGSGFIVSKDGYILTNNHVVGGADVVNVKLADGRSFRAKTVGTDRHSDVAVIKIDAGDLPTLDLGDSEKLEVGEWVVAIGNPFGLSRTVTAGIVSAKGRARVGVSEYEDFIQTDAAINPGNSGGPLLNLAGEAVGINTAIFSRSGGYMGIGFAIPISMAKSIYNQLVKHGKVDRAFLGVTIQTLTPELAASFGIGGKRGVLVDTVVKGTPAAKAGVKRGDVITAVDERPFESAEKFRNHIALTGPGTRITLVVIREGEKKRIPVTLMTRDKAPDLIGNPAEVEKLGIAVKSLDADEAKRFGYDLGQGVLVARITPGSPAQMVGLRPGVLILEVNRKPVRSVQDFTRHAAAAVGSGSVLLLVQEGDVTRFVAITLR